MEATRQEITMQPVESSQIAAIGHHAESNTLAIEFTAKNGPGSVYHYQNFTAEQFAAFAGAESVGKHFYAHIKPFAEKHPYQKIEAVAPAPVESLPGGQRYSTTTFKDNGDPILPNADGTRSVFCDVDE